MQRDRIRDEAAAWVVCLSDAPSASDTAEFEAWRAQGVEHEIAYEREMAAWERLDRLVALRGTIAAPNADLIVAPRSRRPQASLMRRVAAIAATGLVVLCGGAAVMWSAAPSQAYATAIGERRLVRLQDGSTIELNTDTKVIVRYRHGTRSVELVHGEAMFHIARDARPFSIKTAKGRVDAQVADLSVRGEADRTEVAVSNGAALAQTGDGAPMASTALGPDSEATITAGAAQVHPVSADELQRLLAWRQGEIALNGQTLAEAVADFNRYNVRKIAIVDRATGAIRVGGYFRTADVDGFVTAITRTFPVVVSAQSDAEIRLAKKS